MSVLLEFAIFPTDKGSSVSEYVGNVINMIRATEFPYQLTPMGTIVETETMQEATKIIVNAEAILAPHSNRIYCSATFDIRKGKSNRMVQKIKSIESRIGKVNH